MQFAGDKLALHNLELDEAAALTLYTMECELYPTVNGLLRNRNRKELIPFFPYVLLPRRRYAILPALPGAPPNREPSNRKYPINLFSGCSAHPPYLHVLLTTRNGPPRLRRAKSLFSDYALPDAGQTFKRSLGPAAELEY